MPVSVVETGFQKFAKKIHNTMFGQNSRLPRMFCILFLTVFGAFGWGAVPIWAKWSCGKSGIGALCILGWALVRFPSLHKTDPYDMASVVVALAAVPCVLGWPWVLSVGLDGLLFRELKNMYHHHPESVTSNPTVDMEMLEN